MVNPDGSGPLRQILEDACTEYRRSLKELTVLSEQLDPYRRDTVKGHQEGAWLKEMIERSVPDGRRIHLRGLHYVFVASAGIYLPGPGGKPYVNTEECWSWLADSAAKSARWLGYIPFERIVDERNAAPELFLPEYFSVEPERHAGACIVLPDLADALPGFQCADWPTVQPFRIIFIGEKTSLRSVLLPIAQLVGGELLLPTGEISDTQIAAMAARAADDDRPSVVLYFSDFDPSGRQMPTSVARKLQALRDLLYPTLDIRLHPVALTLAQVQQLDLPSTPLKETERRGDNWREAMNREQTEIDALAALAPQTLTRIAQDAIKPFYDPGLARRTYRAQEAWQQTARELAESQAGYAEARAQISNLLDTVNEAVAELQAAQYQASAALEEVEPPAVELPQAVIWHKAPEPLFTTDDDYASATRKLLWHKKLLDP
jgi:hypothetical protein